MTAVPATRPLLMGILNVTPDSFSDGGRFMDPERALEHARRLAREGADIIDVGGESTRPGAQRVPVEEQKRRTLELLRVLRGELPDELALSIDTTSAQVARAALDAGATLINDVSAGRDDPGMFPLAAETGARLVLMHMQGTPATMQAAPRYRDVVKEVRDFLFARADAAIRAGVDAGRIVIDPGIGFGKTREHNMSLLANLARLTGGPYPVLLGASRKRFMGSICRETDFGELVGATCATTVLGVLAGVRMFRVHDVRQNRQAIELVCAFRDASTS